MQKLHQISGALRGRQDFRVVFIYAIIAITTTTWMVMIIIIADIYGSHTVSRS